VTDNGLNQLNGPPCASHPPYAVCSSPRTFTLGRAAGEGQSFRADKTTVTGSGWLAICFGTIWGYGGGGRCPGMGLNYATGSDRAGTALDAVIRRTYPPS